MAKSILFTTPVIYRLPTLIREVAQGQVQIPRFQRPFVWTDDQRLLLLDSVREGLPIGSLLLWRTNGPKLNSYDTLGPFRMDKPPEEGTQSYLLDGHQRVSTLFGALHSAPPFSEEAADRPRWPIYYDLDGEKFCLKPRSKAKPPETWLPLWTLFDARELFKAQRPLLEKDQGELAYRAEVLAEQFKDFQIPVIPLQSESLEQVLESFRRVNSQGTKMAEVHLVRAMSWKKNYDLLDVLQGVLDTNLTPLGWGKLEPQDLLDAIKVVFDLNVYRAEESQISKVVQDKGNLELFSMNIQQAIGFLRDTCNVFGPNLLPYKYQLACLTAATKRGRGAFSAAARERLRRWFWTTTYGEYFAGMMDRGIRAAAEYACGLVAGDGEPAPRDWITDVSPVGLFRWSGARGKALSLLLLRHQPRDAHGHQWGNNPERTASYDADDFPKIVTAAKLGGDEDLLSDGAENRWCAPPEFRKAMEKELAKGASANAAFLASHFISAEAADAYAKLDFQAFLRLRRQAIEDAERQFVEPLGLSYVATVGAVRRPPPKR